MVLFQQGFHFGFFLIAVHNKLQRVDFSSQLFGLLGIEAVALVLRFFLNAAFIEELRHMVFLTCEMVMRLRSVNLKTGDINGFNSLSQVITAFHIAY
ncbi:hypothetical protein H744_2c1666 [Photobacterium gaetbulicola Gung47]|uniref:Uncharacterized protein n=1 Tax=Photobacterium gaetbulicola Gung47 TaxID=658445 RepID=A0A0C5WTH3_9GAMM|nr:hypothetical protein H744_2c1666 [Photobacterium gaetbulicola Gung47]